LLRQIGFGLFLLVVARRVILAIFIPTAMCSTMEEEEFEGLKD
jgi:hypothetical protein